MSARNIGVFYKKQVGLGQPASGAGARTFRFNSGNGLQLRKEKIRSNESRRDGQRQIGRHGARSVGGAYPADASLQTFDPLLADLLRNDWQAELVIEEGDGGVTGITTTTNKIIAEAGSWITAGLRKGDVIVLTNHAKAENNGKNLRVVDLSATEITLPAGSLTADAVPDEAFTITRGRKVVHASAGALIKSYFTFEEREDDPDASLLFTDVRTAGLQIQMDARGMVTFTFSFVGRDMEVLEGADSPHFSSPVETSTIALAAVDSAIRLGGRDIATLTGLNINCQRGVSTVAVAGSNVSPDVYDGELAVDGNVTAIREDMEELKAFLNEDHLSLHLLCAEPDAEPQDYLSIFIPVLTFDGNDRQMGNDGPTIQTIPFEAGIGEAVAGVDRSAISFGTSAADLDE